MMAAAGQRIEDCPADVAAGACQEDAQRQQR
jgi:hypothetical protein